MRLNDKGFAISSMLYSILLLFLMLIVGVLAILGNRKVILDKVKSEIITDLIKNRAYSFSFAHKDILLANTSKVGNFTFDLLDGVKVIDQNGNVVETTITTTSSPTFNSEVNGTYVVTYKANYEGYNIEEERIIEVVDPITYDYAYTGGEQEFVVPVNGVYRTELWGASGGNAKGIAENYGGKGAYVSGTKSLTANSSLYVYVGGKGQDASFTGAAYDGATRAVNGGYNGGGNATGKGNCVGSGGGGATHLSLEKKILSDLKNQKESILMVASGGGGASGDFERPTYEGSGGAGGIVNGENGKTRGNTQCLAYGATQDSGGISDCNLNGSFGANLSTASDGGAGGGGYYAGGSSVCSGGGGGSSFISKDIQVVNTKAGNEEMPTYDGTGTMTGNEGNGYAKITALIIDNGKVATNLIQNSGFENGTTNWSLSNTEIVTEVSKTGASSLKFKPNVTAMSSQTMATPTPSHVYYGSVEFLSSSTFTASDNRFEWFLTDGANSLMVFARKSNQTTDWIKLSSLQGLQTPNSGSWGIRNFLVNANEVAYADNLFIIDLTEIYGAGNEPPKEWCDANIHYFDGVGIVPKY